MSCGHICAWGAVASPGLAGWLQVVSVLHRADLQMFIQSLGACIILTQVIMLVTQRLFSL